MKTMRALKLLFAAAALLQFSASGAQAWDFRVCADPDNLPFSMRDGSGFENKIADVLARTLGASSVTYTWQAQKRGFIRTTLNAGLCDVIMGVPAGIDMLRT